MNEVVLKKNSLLSIQQSLETACPPVLETLICQEKFAKKELDHTLHCQYLFWKEKTKMLSFKNGDRNNVFFHVVVKKNYSGIHRLRTDNGGIEDPKLIEDHILDIYRNLYVDSNPNAQITGNMEDFIGTYIPAMVSFEENIMLIKCPGYLEIKNVVFNLNGNSALGLDGFSGVFYHSCWEIIGTHVCKAFQQFLNKTGFFLG